MKDRRTRGFASERELVRKLWKEGFAAIRAPASGSKVKRTVYPDVVAIYHGKVFVFEVKRRKKLVSIYIPKPQLNKLLEFAQRANATPFVAVRIDELKTWKIIPIDKLEDRGDKYFIPKNVIEEASTLEQFISAIKNITLDKFIKR